MNKQNNWEDRLSEIYARQADTVWRVCYSYMQNPDDTDDMVQETFIRLMTRGPEFTDENHERAWLVVTASNICKDALRSKERQNYSLEDHPYLTADEPEDDLTSLIMNLNENCKTVVYMFYYEGYRIREIARMLNISEINVRVTLHRARQKLKKMLEE